MAKVIGPIDPIQLGSTVELVCDFSGAPPPMVQWDKDGAPLGNSSSPHLQISTLANSSTVMLNNVQTGDEGMYKCLVKSTVGTSNDTFVLTIQFTGKVIGS